MQQNQGPVLVYLPSGTADPDAAEVISVHTPSQLVEALSAHPRGRIWMRAEAFDALGTTLRARLLERVELVSDTLLGDGAAAQPLLESLKRQIYKACEASLEGMLISDCHGRILMANPSSATILGESPEQLLNHNLWRLLVDRLDPSMYRQLQAEVHTNGYWRGELHGLRHNGERYPLWLSVNMIRNEYDNSINYVINISDISKLRRSEEQLAYLAQHDCLTGLLNRNALDKYLHQVLQSMQTHRRQLAVLFIDLDRFKPVNDMFGHAAGDLLLTLVAQRLQAAVRRNDMIARIGGDEFAVVLQGVDNLDCIAQIAEKLIHHLSMEYVLGDKPVNISASVGISLYPQDGITAAQLMQQADAAMYAAKRSNGIGYCQRYSFYNRCQSQHTRARYQLEQDLRTALANKQFQVVFQPIIDLADHHIVAVETLLRWNHPQRGKLPAAEFLAQAEESGLSMALAEMVINEAFRIRSGWSGQTAEIPHFTLNISLSQLQPDLIELMHEALLVHQCRPQWFVLEIQEDILAERQGLLELLAKLHKLGFSLSIDGVSLRLMELELLRDLPVCRLKLPRRLIQRSGNDPISRAMIQSMLLLGHSMNMKVTATGVETVEQLACLRQARCDEAQGNMLIAPLEAGALLDFLSVNCCPMTRLA